MSSYIRLPADKVLAAAEKAIAEGEARKEQAIERMIERLMEQRVGFFARRKRTREEAITFLNTPHPGVISLRLGIEANYARDLSEAYGLRRLAKASQDGFVHVSADGLWEIEKFLETT